MPEKVALVVNPRSAGGRTARSIRTMAPGLQHHVGPHTVLETHAPGHATDLVRQALHDGCTRIISAGGDGTHYEVINGFFENGAAINPDAVLALLPSGTGSDLARGLRIPKGRAALPTLMQTETITADVGQFTYTTFAGDARTAYFLNTCHIGIGGEVAVQVGAASKRFGGFIAFLSGILRALVKYTDQPMHIDIDGRIFEQPIKGIVVSKAEYDGGGIHIAPHARFDNGLFEVYVIGPVSFFDALRSLPKLYQGRLEERPDIVKYFRCKRLAVETTGTAKVSPHGEVAGVLPATFEVLPGALRVVGNLSKEMKDELDGHG